MKTVCLDFDGVIHRASKGRQYDTIYDPPVPGAFDAIRAFQKAECPVVICSCRNPHQIADWIAEYAPDLKLWKTPGDTTKPLCEFDSDPLFWNHADIVLVTRLKPAAALYIDDNALRFSLRCSRFGCGWRGILTEALTMLGIRK